MKTTIFYLLILVIFASCKKYDSSELDQSDIKQIYTVRYNKATNSTFVQANFYKGNVNSVVLQNPSIVKFNNTVLTYNRNHNGYEAYFNGEVTNGQFIYINNNGQTYVNSSIYVAPIGLSNLIGFYLDKNRPFTFGLGSSQYVNDGSNIRLSFANKNFYATNSYFDYTITIDANDLQNINSGYYYGNLIRSRETNIQQSTGAGGRIKNEYVGDNLSIQVY